jgi:penicillin-binding protein 1B
MPIDLRRLRPATLVGVALALATATATPPAGAASLERELGRNETRVYSEPYAIAAGSTVEELALPARLERLHYRRVRERPAEPGQYFFGNQVFWVYRRACHARGAERPAELFGLELDPRGGRILGLRRDDGSVRPIRGEADAWLEPEILAESLRGDRAARVPIDLDDLPERVWRAVLAAEDARFFEHGGVDPRSVARAAWSNLRKGRVAEGGSTITQQLIKNRDLSPKRTLGRKANEAMRALALEAEHDKREILQAYLNSVYLGNVGGLAVHGMGAAARAYFSKRAADLGLAESAALAAMIQAPNRLSPIDDADALQQRRDWVLGRMAELGWASAGDAERAAAQPVRARPSPPRASAPRHLLGWVAERVADEKPERAENGRGFQVETTLDPWLQGLAEDAVRAQLVALRRGYPLLRGAGLQAALVALDARTGAVIAYVGGDPDAPRSEFDHARLARRQPGSVVKPFVALHAIDRCGGREPLTASSRIADSPLAIDLPSGRWEPENFDRRWAGVVLLREALAESRNVPVVRIARWCGFDATAETFERAGFTLPRDPPPSFVLGAVESSPLAVARAYTVLATPGRALDPFPIALLQTAGGRGIDRDGKDPRRVSSEAAAYVVRDLLRTAVERGTATPGDVAGLDVAAKTGSSSELRDAWFAGVAGSVVAVVWVGLEDGGRLGLTGAQAAAPIWRGFMSGAAPARARLEIERPRDVVEQWVELGTGLVVREGRDGARPELYLEGTLPTRRRWWRLDQPMPVIE